VSIPYRQHNCAEVQIFRCLYTTFLLGTNFDVEYINQEKLDEMIPGQSKYFRSTDAGRSELLRSCAACKVLTLKVGAPVILIRNISEGLYNGVQVYPDFSERPRFLV
jgi:hypothetical protein